MEKKHWYYAEHFETKIFFLVDRMTYLFLEENIKDFFLLSESNNEKDRELHWKILSSEDYKEEKENIFIEESVKIAREPDRKLKVCLEKKVIIISEPIEKNWQKQHFLRLIRILMRFEFSNVNALFLHSGMVAFENYGVCIVGERRSGKTTTIINLLKRREFSFVSNDDLALKQENEEFFGYGWPRSVCIRKDTLAVLMPDLKNNKKYQLKHPANYAEDKIETFLFVNELCNFLGCSITKKQKINVVVFPEFHDETDSKLVKLTKSELKLLLIKNSLKNINKYSDFLEQEYNSNLKKEDASKLLDRVCEKIVGYRLLQNFESLDQSYNLLKNLSTNNE